MSPTKANYASRIYQNWDYTLNLIDVGMVIIDYLCEKYSKEQLRLLCEEADEGAKSSSIDDTLEFVRLKHKNFWM